MTIKTTIELPEPLFVQAKRYAAERNMTLKALIEQGLRGAMARPPESAPFVLHDASFRGKGGYTPEFESARWEQVRDVAYEGRGA